MKIAVIVNARAKLARSQTGLATIKTTFGGLLHSLDRTASAHDAIDVVRRAARDEVDTVVVVGGDGSINSVLDVLAGTKIALGVIPNGTANDLCTLHKLPSRLSTACDVILRRQVRAVDLVSINGRHFVTGGGLGLPAAVAARANEIKRRGGLAKMARVVLGSELYLASTVPALLSKLRPGVRLTIQSDQGPLVEVDSLALMINNQPFVGRHFYLAPLAANDDSQFDVCLVENPRSRIELAATLLQVLHGSHVNLPSVTSWRAEELHVRVREPLPFYADGEHLGTHTQFAMRIVPQSLNLIVPGDQGRLASRAICRTDNPGNGFAERLAAALGATASPNVNRHIAGAPFRAGHFHRHAQTMDDV